MQNFKKNSKFYGDLDVHMTLSDVFETLGTKKRNGWLFIGNDIEETCFYFNGNSVGLVDFPKKEISFIPEKLYHSAKISKEIYEKIKKYKIPLSLLEKYVEKQEIIKILDTIVFDEICKFFKWKKGYFYFVEESNMEDREKKYPASSLFDARDLLMEAARRWDEWSEIEKKLPHTMEIFKHNISPSQKLSIDEPLGNIWSIAENNNIEEIINLSYFSRFSVCKIVCSLLNSKQLRIMTKEELFQLGKQEEEKGNLAKASICYHILYKRTPFDVKVYDFLLESYKKQNKVEELKDLYQELAKRLMANDKPEYRIPGVKYLKNWIEMLPEKSEESIQNRLLLLEMVLRSEIDASSINLSPVDEGIKLIKILAETNQEEVRLGLVKKLIQYAPENIFFRERLLEILQEKKDIEDQHKNLEEIIQQYEAIARIFEKQNNLNKTEEFYKKILQISPSRIDILPKIKSLSVRKMNLLEQKKKCFYAAIFFIVILLGVVFYRNYKSNQEQELSLYKERIAQALEKGELDKASNLLRHLEEKDQEEIRKKITQKWEEAEQRITHVLDLSERLKEQGDAKSALQILSQALKPDTPEKYRDRILLQQESLKKIITHFEESLQSAHLLEEKGDYENALNKYLEIWKNFDFRSIKERNSIKLPVKLSTVPDEVYVSIDNEKPFLYKTGEILRCSPKFGKITVSMTGYHSAILYNSFFSRENFGTQEKNLYFFQSSIKEIALSKDMLYSFPLGNSLEGEICYGNKILFLSCRDGYIYAFENLENTPGLKWKKKIGLSVSLSSAPCYYKKILYIKGNDGYFYALDSQKEEIPVLGKFSIERALNSYAVPALSHNLIVVVANNRMVVLPSISQKENFWNAKWQYTFSYPIKAAPAIEKDKVVAGSADGFLYCFDLFSGALRWKYRAGFPVLASATIFNDVVYIGVYGTLYAFDINTGNVLWTSEIGGMVEGSALVYDDKVFIGTFNRNLYAFSTKGQFLWDFKANGILKTTPAASKRTIFLCCEQGWLYALDINTGRLIWKYSIGDEYLSSPMIIENKIFIGGKKLYTFLDN